MQLRDVEVAREEYPEDVKAQKPFTDLEPMSVRWNVSERPTGECLICELLGLITVD